MHSRAGAPSSMLCECFCLAQTSSSSLCLLMLVPMVAPIAILGSCLCQHVPVLAFHWATSACRGQSSTCHAPEALEQGGADMCCLSQTAAHTLTLLNSVLRSTKDKVVTKTLKGRMD